MEWTNDKSIQKEINFIIKKLDLSYIDPERIFCYRTKGSKARAYARIWSFPKIFQDALKIEPAYVIEVLSEKYERLPEREKQKVLVHELMHIPKNFSGSLLPHFHGFDKKVKELYKKLES